MIWVKARFKPPCAGWAVSGIEPFYTAMVEGHLVAWFRAESAAPLNLSEDLPDCCHAG